MVGTRLATTQCSASDLADGVTTTANEVPTRFANMAKVLFDDSASCSLELWVGLRRADSRADYERYADPFLSPSLADSKGFAGRVNMGGWSREDVVLGIASSPRETGLRTWFGAPRGLVGPLVFCKRIDQFFRPTCVECGAALVSTASPAVTLGGTALGEAPAVVWSCPQCRGSVEGADTSSRLSAWTTAMSSEQPEAGKGTCRACDFFQSCYAASGVEAVRLLVSVGDPVAGIDARSSGLLVAGEYAELVGGAPFTSMVDGVRRSGDGARADWLNYKLVHDPSYQALASANSCREWSWQDALAAKLTLCCAVAAEVQNSPAHTLGADGLLGRTRVNLTANLLSGDVPWRFALHVEAHEADASALGGEVVTPFKGRFTLIGVDEDATGTVLRVSVRANDAWSSALVAARSLTLNFGAGEGFVHPLDVVLDLDGTEGELFTLRGKLVDVPAVAITQMRILRHLRDLDMAFSVVVKATPPAPTFAPMGEFVLVTLFAQVAQSAAHIRGKLTDLLARCRVAGLSAQGLTRALTDEPTFSLNSLCGNGGANALLELIREISVKMLVDETGYAANGGWTEVIADLQRALSKAKQSIAIQPTVQVEAPPALAPVGVSDADLADVLASLISDSQWLENALSLDRVTPVEPVRNVVSAAKTPPPPPPPPIIKKLPPVVPVQLEDIDLDATMVMSHEQVRQVMKDERKAAAAPPAKPAPVHEPNLDETMVVSPGWRPEPKK